MLPRLSLAEAEQLHDYARIAFPPSKPSGLRVDKVGDKWRLHPLPVAASIPALTTMHESLCLARGPMVASTVTAPTEVRVVAALFSPKRNVMTYYNEVSERKAS